MLRATWQDVALCAIQGNVLPSGQVVKLPDSEGVLVEAGALCYNDADFLGDESQRMVHPSIPNADADGLGALSLLMRNQVVSHFLPASLRLPDCASFIRTLARTHSHNPKRQPIDIMRCSPHSLIILVRSCRNKFLNLASRSRLVHCQSEPQIEVLFAKQAVTGDHRVQVSIMLPSRALSKRISW